MLKIMSKHSLKTPPVNKSQSELFDNLAKNAKRRSVRRYYENQAELLRNFNEDRLLLKKFVETNASSTSSAAAAETKERNTGKEKRMCYQLITNITIFLNVFLLIIKIVAGVISHSLSIFSSVVDSAVDLSASIVICYTSRAIRIRDPYRYPRGRTRLEPLAIIVISVIMGIASIEMISKSVKTLVEDDIAVNCEWWTIGIMITTIVTKFGLYVLCRCYRSPNTDVLAQDHRNDCLSNAVAIICAFVADQFWEYLDPIGAILVSLYICGTWWVTGKRHIGILSGRAAEPEFYCRIIRVAFEHDPTQVRAIDTVQVYHLGTQFLVEVHVVLDRNMPVHQSHDISETLQRKIEHLPYVERSFVHVDYEATHRPDSEHKIV